MCEKDVGANSGSIWGCQFFPLGVLVGNFEYVNIYFFIGRPIPFRYTVFGRWFEICH